MHLIHYSPQTVFINLLLLLVSPCVVKYLYSEPRSHAAGLLSVSAAMLSSTAHGEKGYYPARGSLELSLNLQAHCHLGTVLNSMYTSLKYNTTNVHGAVFPALFKYCILRAVPQCQI